MKTSTGNFTGYSQARNAGDEQQSFLKNLASAINRNELSLHYQPRYELTSGKTVVLEALARWRRPNVGLLYPETFINAAEQNGLIFQLDLWAFEQGCRDLLWFKENLENPVKLAVNISALSCESVYFSQKLIELCKKYELTLADFVLEITVSTHSHDIRKVKAFCETLGNFGAKICLDDFGTGQSPLMNLYELPVNSINIDRTFIGNIGESERTESIIRHMVSLAHDLGITTVAEGVENKYQYKFLSEIGCDQIQGHLMSRPVGREKLTSEKLTFSNTSVTPRLQAARKYPG